jgi:CheY-like chemotaxis protein
VEDNQINQQVALGMLHKLGVTVAVAANGREAIEAVAQHSYDLVLMDCEMPEMDGFTATRLLRQQERERGVKPLPIIAMTAHAVQSARAQCMAAGMDDYLAKPMKQEALATILSYWLAKNAPEEALTVSDSDTASWVEAPTPAVLNPQSLQDLREMLQDNFGLLLQTCLKEFPAQLTALQQALAQGDAGAFRRTAHGLKSSSTYLGAVELADLAQALEALGQTGNLEAATLLIGQAEAAYQRVRPLLEALRTGDDPLQTPAPSGMR